MDHNRFSLLKESKSVEQTWKEQKEESKMEQQSLEFCYLPTNLNSEFMKLTDTKITVFK